METRLILKGDRLIITGKAVVKVEYVGLDAVKSSIDT